MSEPGAGLVCGHSGACLPLRHGEYCPLAAWSVWWVGWGRVEQRTRRAAGADTRYLG
nr:hypothetical protein [Kibdelosporangium sp. MJ126-NF4]